MKRKGENVVHTIVAVALGTARPPRTANPRPIPNVVGITNKTKSIGLGQCIQVGGGSAVADGR